MSAADNPVTLEGPDGDGMYLWPGGSRTIAAVFCCDDGTYGARPAGEMEYTKHATPEEAAAHLGARLPDPVGSKTEPTDAGPYDDDLARRILEWRGRGALPTETVTIPAAALARMICAGDPTTRERELQAQVEAQAVRMCFLEDEVDGIDAALAMPRAGLRRPGDRADRIRILAERHTGPLTPQVRGIVAELLACLSLVVPTEYAPIIRALRLALDIES